MREWVDNGLLAGVIGAAAFAALFLPGLAWQYRRFGRLSFARLLGLAAVCLYATALFTYTLLPLPDRATVCSAYSGGVNLRPFSFIEDFRRLAVGRTFTEFVTTFTVLQVAFNVVLFIPFGVILRRYFARSILFATLLGFVASWLIELTQLTGFWFIYPCAYRAADIDDVLANTLGAFVGAVLAPLLLWWMPRAQQLQEERLVPRPVTVWRRWVGMAIDGTLVVLTMWGAGVGARVVAVLLGARDPEWVGWVDRAGIVGATLIVFVWPAWNHLAASVGQTAVWLTPRWRTPDGGWHDGSRWQRVLRSLIVSGPWTLAFVVGHGPWLWLLLVVPAAIVLVPFTKTHRSLSGLLTRAYIVDIREADATRALPVHPRRGGAGGAEAAAGSSAAPASPS